MIVWSPTIEDQTIDYFHSNLIVVVVYCLPIDFIVYNNFYTPKSYEPYSMNIKPQNLIISIIAIVLVCGDPFLLNFVINLWNAWAFLHIWINDVSNQLAWFKQKISSPNQEDFRVVVYFLICHFMININNNRRKWSVTWDKRRLLQWTVGVMGLVQSLSVSPGFPKSTCHISNHFLFTPFTWTNCPQTGIIDRLNTQSVSANCPSYCTQFSNRVEFPSF